MAEQEARLAAEARVRELEAELAKRKKRDKQQGDQLPPRDSATPAPPQGQVTACPFLWQSKGGKVAAPRILPQGFIDRITDDGAIIMFTSPRNSHSLHPETRWS